MRAMRAVFAVMVIVLGIGAMMHPEGTSAAEFRTGDQTKIPSTETINDDLYITGGTVSIDGRVTGDVIAAGGDVNIAGQIGGSVQVLGGSIDIKGDIGGSLRVLGGDVTVSGDVGGDVVLAGGSFTLQSGGTVDGDVIVAGGDVDLLGPVGGDVRGNARNLTINAPVAGDVDVTVEDVRLLSKARIAGDFTYESRNEVSKADGAFVTGRTQHTEGSSYYPGDNLTSWLSSPLFRLLCGLIAGLILVLLVPRGMAAVADAARLAPLTSLLIGLLLLFVVPILLVILAVTLVGIPMAVIGLFAYLTVLYLSQVFLGLAIGRLILPSSWDTRSRGYNLLAMTIGVLILGGLRMIPLPFVSGVIALVTAILGLGAVAIAVRSSRRAVALPTY
jgi:cytoskeletal protein CcmA (bactofilin family)